MKTDEKNEMLFEELLKQALKEDLDRELSQIPSEEELKKTVVFSERHQRRIGYDLRLDGVLRLLPADDRCSGSGARSRSYGSL